MIKQDQIEEWIHEVEERPSSGPLIVRFVSNRLRDLTNRNEELLAENIALRTGQRAEEYESRIANLEYQLELLKRQVGSEGLASITSSASVETMVGIAYTIHGYVFRLSFSLTELTSGTKLPHRLPRVDEGEPAPRLFATTPKEELLFVFDSGRTVTLPVDQIEECGQDAADWKTATLIEPRGGEELAAVLPVARMTLFDTCAQTSRRGYARKLLRTTFETHIAKNFIGTGVKQKPDRTGGLVLCGKDDQLVMVSQEGFLVGMDVNGLPFTAEEMLRLSPTDHIISSFVTGKKTSLLFATQNSKVIVRETGWVEKPLSGKGRGQPVFSQTRREAGARLVGAAAVETGDWGMALDRDGSVTVYAVEDIIAAGSLGGSTSEIVEFVTFSAPQTRQVGEG